VRSNSRNEKTALVLVIDDEEVIRDSCRQILSSDEITVEMAGDGPSGLEKVKEVSPDVVLVDLKMPGMSGIEVLENIIKIDEQIIPIVITGFATIQTAIEAMKKGSYDFVPKPFTPDQLRITVKRGLEKRRLSLEAISLRKDKEKLTQNFISIVSHEISSPLALVNQNIQILIEGLLGELPDRQKDFLSAANKKLVGLLSLVTDWQRIVSISSQKIAGSRRPVKLAEIFIGLRDDVKNLLNDRKVSLTIDIPEDLPEIYGDRERLKEVFVNLLSNSIKYNLEHGSVKITVKENGSSLAISVSDTGIGIDPEHIPHIFNEFYRAGGEGYSGAGLGLFIVKKIVEAHSGKIEVISQPGKGSTFIVFLPKVEGIRN